MKTLKTTILISLLSVSFNSFADLNTGLVAYWNFDDCTANDVSGNNNNGILNGNIQCVQSIVGTGLLFDGNSSIDLGQMDYLPKKSLTFSLWIKKAENGRVEGFIGKWNSSPYTNNSFLMYNGEQTYIDHVGFRMQLSNGKTGVVNSKNKISVNKFTNITVTWSSSTGIVKLYQDGILSASNNIGKGLEILNGVDGYTAKIADWGQFHNGSYRFKGMLDEIRLYDRELSSFEINELYNLAVPINGTIKSLSSHTIDCKNETTGQIVNISASKATTYDCEAKGLKADIGDDISIVIKGKNQ